MPHDYERAEASKDEIFCCAWCGHEIDQDHYRFWDEGFAYRIHDLCYQFVTEQPEVDSLVRALSRSL